MDHLIGDSTTIYKNAPKRMKIKIPIPADFYGSLIINMTNLKFSSDQIIEFCGFAISDTGVNLPCVHPTKDVASMNGTWKELPDGDGLLDSAQIVISNICHVPYSGDDKDNYVSKTN